MPFVTRHSLMTLGVASVAAGAVLGIFVWSGIYNIGADDTHTKPVYALMQAMREQSINRYASAIKVPDLTDAALIRQGAGNYDSMCTGCHLAPGMESTELSRGLYPAPPALATADVGNPAHHFWVIKHGIKASGMPAWGKSMDDQYIWGMVAFIQQLPKLDAAGYRAMVDSSGGHSHGGGETEAHHDDESMPAHTEAAPTDAAPHEHAPGTPPHVDAPAPPKMQTHRHADGTVESHPVVEPASKPADAAADAEEAEDHPDHQH
jgi:mono/diheme cytochrome c family protein